MSHPRGRYRVPLLIVLVECLTVGLWYAARALFPQQWGGPNIGGGLVLMLGYALAAVGMVMVIGQLVADRQERRGKF